MQLLDGKFISNKIKEEIKEEVEALKKNGERPPHLAAILVGNDGASLTYVGSKVRSCEQIGFDSTLIKLDEDISEDKLIANIASITSRAPKIRSPAPRATARCAAIFRVSPTIAQPR